MNKDIISIVIPVYKVEKYLKKCIESIINQTYPNLEIILIDDGSPDNCGKICDDYAKKDKRIKVIHKENEGLSKTRNTGIENATGKYIGFFDSDDYASKTMYEDLKNNIDKYNSDIAVGTYYKRYKFIRKIVNKTKKEQVFTEKDKFINAKDGNKCVTSGVCNKLYKRKIFENLRYPEGKVYEDSYIIYNILEEASSVSYLPKPVYYYRIRKSGIIRGKNTKYYDQVDAMDKNIKLLNEKKYYDLVDQEKYRKVHAIIKIANKLGLKSINDSSYKKEKKDAIKTAQEIKNSKYLTSNQKNTINTILNDIDKFYKRKAFKTKLNRLSKSILYYK